MDRSTSTRSVAPSPTPAGDLTFDLDVATPHDVSVVLDDVPRRRLRGEERAGR